MDFAAFDTVVQQVELVEGQKLHQEDSIQFWDTFGPSGLKPAGTQSYGLLPISVIGIILKQWIALKARADWIVKL